MHDSTFSDSDCLYPITYKHQFSHKQPLNFAVIKNINSSFLCATPNSVSILCIGVSTPPQKHPHSFLPSPP